MLVVGEVAGQVAQGGTGTGGQGAPAVAEGAHRRPGGEEELVDLAELGRLERLEGPGGGGVLVDLLDRLHRDAAGGDPLVGPDRVQEHLVGGEPLVLEARDLGGHVVEHRLGAGELLHRDQADALGVGGVEGLVERVVLGGEGVVLDHDHVDHVGLGRGGDHLGELGVVDREADELGLARLPDRVGGLAEFLALEELDALVDGVVVAHAVEEVGVNRVQFQGRQPLVELGDELLG